MLLMETVDWFVKKGPFADKSDLRDMGGDFNGYVVIPEGHPYFGVHADEIPVDVHGGWTFSGRYGSDLDWEELKDEYKTKKHWVVGWDTLHAGDSRAKWPKSKVEKENARAAMELYTLGIKKEREKNSKLRK